MRRSRREEAVIFVGSLCSSPEVFASVAPVLQKKFGDTLYESPSLPWNYSSYYDEELGAPLFRNFLFFDPIVDPVSLPDAKRATVEMEEEFSTEGRRRINLDPGYLTLAKVVLASTKNYSHRIYLGKGVFCELELFYEKGRFNPLPYTYFDYREKAFISIFVDARRSLKKKLGLAGEDSGKLR
jgi:hypothetical protein